MNPSRFVVCMKNVTSLTALTYLSLNIIQSMKNCHIIQLYTSAFWDPNLKVSHELGIEGIKPWSIFRIKKALKPQTLSISLLQEHQNFRKVTSLNHPQKGIFLIDSFMNPDERRCSTGACFVNPSSYISTCRMGECKGKTPFILNKKKTSKSPIAKIKKKKLMWNEALVGGLFQPLWKICSSNWIIFPRDRGEKKI